ncbi:MAG: hypothetical protein U9Q67_03655, partial [Patescibacteria group bacterium]|nr:hypothetical protein [Patescibacteria group bacterium]
MTNASSKNESGGAPYSEVAVLNQETLLPYNTTLTIGSGETASIRIEDDNTVEPNHLLFAATDQGVVVRDISETGNSRILISKQETSLVGCAGRIVPEGAFIEIGDNTLLRVTSHGGKGWALKRVQKERTMGNLQMSEHRFHQSIIEIIYGMGINVPTVVQAGDLQDLRRIKKALANREPSGAVISERPTIPIPKNEIIKVEPGKPIKLPPGKTVILGKEGHIRPSKRDRKVEKEHLLLASTPDGVIARDLGSKNGVEVYVGGQLSKLTAQKAVHIPDGAVIKLSSNTLYRVIRGENGAYELIEFSREMVKFVQKSPDLFERFEKELFSYSIAREFRNYGLAIPYWDHESDKPLSLVARIRKSIKTPQPRNVPPDFIWPPGKEDVVETLQPDNAVVISSESSPEHGNQDCSGGVILRDGQLGLVMMDGAGSGLSKLLRKILTQREQDAAIAGVTETMVAAAVEALSDGESLDEALHRAHEVGTRCNGCAAGMVVKVGLPDEKDMRKVSGASRGDCVAARYNPAKTFRYSTAPEYWELRDRAISQLNHLQVINLPASVAFKGADSGEIQMGQVEGHPTSATLYKHVGSTNECWSDMFEVTLEPTELLVIASDGIRIGDLLGLDPATNTTYYHAVEVHGILRWACANPSPKNIKIAEERIIAILREAGERDDITIAIVPP